ncbi:hypothetical protein [Congregibacter sp.]|uniref:hypothetical protein n=1 Tax=Congregibacter sp. TaxID=2744308 RepID=UPI0039E6B57E
MFGIHIFGTSDAWDFKLRPATVVIAQLLDNNADGEPDDLWVLSNIIGRDAVIVMPKDEAQLDEIDSDPWRKAVAALALIPLLLTNPLEHILNIRAVARVSRNGK